MFDVGTIEILCFSTALCTIIDTHIDIEFTNHVRLKCKFWEW